MNNNKTYYSGHSITIDLINKKYKLRINEKWQKLPEFTSIALTQVTVQQSGGARGATIRHRNKAFCTYLRAGKFHILAYRGKRKIAFEEASKLSDFLNLEIKDLIPRKEDGSFIDDDQLIEPESIQGCFIVLIVIIIIAIIVVLAN